jgi:hypothetical protein
MRYTKNVHLYFSSDEAVVDNTERQNKYSENEI